MQRRASILLILGSVIFIIGGFMFAPTGYFEADGTAEKIAAIEDHQLFWIVGWILSAAGALIVAGGLWAYARSTKAITDDNWITRLSQISAVMAFVGALCRVVMTLMAIFQSAASYVDSESTEETLNLIYSFLTLAAVVLFGIVLYRRRHRILGGFLVIAVVLALVSGTWVVPLTNYIPLAIVSIVLALRSERE